jgi:hypothetical protein
VGLLDRWRGLGRDDGAEPEPGAPSPDDAVTPVESITSRRPSPEEEAALDAARVLYPAHDIDPTDLSSIATAYERALEEAGEEGAAPELVTVLATAIGDHLVGHGYRWVVSTDPFGTDLAVEPPRRPVPVVVHTLVAVRWVKRETGWVEPVVEHLARAGGG